MNDNKVKFASTGDKGPAGTPTKKLSKDDILLQQQLCRMLEERNDISEKARDIELHLESAEYQLEDNKKVNDMLTKAANASEKLMIDIEKHSDATRKQIIETDESFTQTLKQLEESNADIEEANDEEEIALLENNNSSKMKDDYEKKLSSAVSNLTKLFSEGKKEYRKLELGPPVQDNENVDIDGMDIDQARILIPQLREKVKKLEKDIEVADMKNRATYVQWYAERAKLDDFAEHCKKDVESITFRMIAAESKVRHSEQVGRDPNNVEGAVSRKELDDVLLECEKLRAAYVKEYEDKVRLQQLLKAAYHEIDEKNILIQSLQHSKIELNMQIAQLTVKQNKLDDQINHMKEEIDRQLQEKTAELVEQFNNDKNNMINQIDSLQAKLQHQKILIDDLQEKLVARNGKIEQLELELVTAKEQLNDALKLLSSTLNKDIINSSMLTLNSSSLESIDVMNKRMNTEIERLNNVKNSMDKLKNLILDGRFSKYKSRRSLSIDENNERTDSMIDSNFDRVESPGFVSSPNSTSMSPVEVISRSNSPIVNDMVSRGASPMQVVSRINTPKPIPISNSTIERLGEDKETQTEIENSISTTTAKSMIEKMKKKKNFDQSTLKISEKEFDAFLTSSLLSIGNSFSKNFKSVSNLDDIVIESSEKTYDIIMTIQEKVQGVERLRSPTTVQVQLTSTPTQRASTSIQKTVIVDGQAIQVSIDMVDDETETTSELWETALEDYMRKKESFPSPNVPPPALVVSPEEEESDDDIEITDEDIAVRQQQQDSILGEMLQENFQRLIGKGFGSEILVKLTLLNHHLAALVKEDGSGEEGNKLQVRSMKVEKKLLTREVIECTSIRQLSAFKVETESHIHLLGSFNALKLLHHYKTGGIFLDVLNKHRSTIDDCIAASGGWQKAYVEVVENEPSDASTLHWPDFFRIKVLECLREKMAIEKSANIASNKAEVEVFKQREKDYENSIKILEHEKRELTDKIAEIDRKKRDRTMGSIVSKLRRSSAQIVVPDAVYGAVAMSSRSTPTLHSTAEVDSTTTAPIPNALTSVSETTESKASTPIIQPEKPQASTPKALKVIVETPKLTSIVPTSPAVDTPINDKYINFKSGGPTVESLRSLHKSVNRIIVRLLNNDHEAQCLAEALLSGLLAWKDGFFGDARENLNHCVSHFPADPEISVSHELLKLLTESKYEFDCEVAEITWSLEQMIIYHCDQVKNTNEIPLPSVVNEQIHTDHRDQEKESVKFHRDQEKKSDELHRDQEKKIVDTPLHAVVPHARSTHKFATLVHSNLQEIIKKNHIANHMALQRIERQKALEESRKKEEEMLKRWKHDLKIAVEKELEERKPDTMDGTCQTDPLENERELERIESRETERSGKAVSREASQGGVRGSSRQVRDRDTYEETEQLPSIIGLSNQGMVAHPFTSPLPPGFHLVHFRDNEVELCPGIMLASNAKHRIFTKQLPKKVVYVYRGQDAALLKGLQRLPSYITVPSISGCEPVLIPPIFDLNDGVKLIFGSNLGEHNEIELPPDILVVKMSRDAILPNGLTIVELSDIIKVPITAEIPFGFELVQISTSVVLPPGVELCEGIFTAPCPKTLQLPPNVLLVKREETATFPSFLRPMASTTYEEIEVSIHNKISQGCTIASKPLGISFGLGQEILYRIPGHSIPAGMRYVRRSDYPKGLHLSSNFELVQLIPRFDLPNTCSPAPGWFAYPRPLGVRLPATVHLFICEDDSNSGFISLPSCLREVGMPDIPPGMKVPKKVVAAEFFSDSDSPLPEGTIVALGIKVLSVRKYLANLGQSTDYSLPINAVLVERKAGAQLPEGVERGSCSDLPFGHLLGPGIEVLLLSVRFELPPGVKMEPNLVLGQRTQLAPGTILSRDLEVVEWPRFFILPPGLELVKLKPGTDVPAGYVRAQIPAADPICKKIPIGCMIVHLPYIVALPSLQQLTEKIEIVSPALLTADDRSRTPIELPVGIILISREDRENVIPDELQLQSKPSIPDGLKSLLAKYNINARYNSGAKLIEAVKLQPEYSLPPGTELVQGLYVLPRPHWLQLPSGAELVSVLHSNETNKGFIDKYAIDIRPDASPHSTISNTEVALPENFHVVLLPDRYEVFSWQGISPGIDVVSKPDSITLPPNHFLIQRGKMKAFPPGMKLGFSAGFERVGTRTKLPPGIEVIHLKATYRLPLGVDVPDVSVLQYRYHSHNVKDIYKSKDQIYNIDMPQYERLSCGFKILSNPYDFNEANCHESKDKKKYVFVAVDRNHFTWPKNSIIHPNSNEIVSKYYGHFRYEDEMLHGMIFRQYQNNEVVKESSEIEITDYIKYIELPASIPNIRSRLREEISIIKAFIESFRGESVGQMSIEDMVHKPNSTSNSNEDTELNGTRAVVIYPRVRVELVKIQDPEQKKQAKLDFSKLEISNALISHFVDEDGEPLDIDEKLLMNLIESFKGEINVLEKENNEYRIKFTTLSRDHQQLKIRYGRLQSQQASHSQEMLEQKNIITTLKSTVAKLERKLVLKLEDLKLSRNAHEDTKVRMQAQIDVLATQVAHWRDANIDFVTQREAYEKEFEELKKNLKSRQSENIAHSRKECTLVIEFLVQSMFEVFKTITHDAYKKAKASISLRTNILNRDIVELKPIEPVLRARPISADFPGTDFDPDLINPALDDYQDSSTKDDSTRLKTIVSTYSSKVDIPSPRFDDDDVSVLTDDASTSNFLASQNLNRNWSSGKTVQEEKPHEVDYLQVTRKVNMKAKDRSRIAINEQMGIPKGDIFVNDNMYNGPHVYLRSNHHDPQLYHHNLNPEYEIGLKAEQEMLSELENLGKEEILSAIDIISIYFNQSDDYNNIDDFTMVLFGNESSNSIADINKPKGKDFSTFNDINAVLAEAKHGMGIWTGRASQFIDNFLHSTRSNFMNALDMLETEVKVMMRQNKTLQRRYEALSWKFTEFARRNVQTSLLPIDDLRDKIFEQAIIIDRLKDEAMKPTLEDIRSQADQVTRYKKMESHLKLFVLQYNEMAAQKDQKVKRATSENEAKAYRHNAAALRKKATYYKERLNKIQDERDTIVKDISKKLQEFEGAVIGILPPKLMSVLQWSQNHSSNANIPNNVVYTPLPTDDKSITSNSKSKNYDHYYVSSSSSVASSSTGGGSSHRPGSLSSSLSMQSLPANMFSSYSPSALGKMTPIDPVKKIQQLKSFKNKKY